MNHSISNAINILYVSDDNYAMQTGISIMSLLENNNEEHFDIYIFEYTNGELYEEQRICALSKI